MKEENAIEVKNIVKTFRVYMDRGYTLKELVLFKKRRKYEKREVLKGISFSVKKGEAIGLIGHNGCGKSTTLKLLTRIMYPDSGTIEMRGRVSSLIELGAGFHPDMSGRQNIYTNASIFGLTRKEIDARMEKIISFSQLEEFIDNPVRTYSSGMYMRLAFSVAINVNADILLIDEILAVGDAAFQDKCFKKLLEIKGKGTTIVIVSHSLGQIESICERSIWIHDGKIREEGVPQEVHSKYLEFMGQKEKSAEPEAQPQEQQEEPQEEQQKITEIENDKIEEGEPDVTTALDMDKILGEIKHEIEEKQFKLDEVDFEDIPIIQHVDDKIEMQDTFSAGNYEKEFRIMKSRWRVPETPQFTSNNPISQAAKYIVPKLSRCVVIPLVTMQNAFNYSIVRLNGQVRNYIKENEKEKENMQKRIDELEKMLEEIKKNQEKAQ